MNQLIVTYQVNELAGTDRLKMSEQRIEHIDIQCNLNDSEEIVYTEVIQKLSEVEGLPENEIKVTGITIIR